jgi:hypothetical protein
MNSYFYVTLPSDSTADYYPNNMVAPFVTKLPEHIRLEGDYEIELAEFIYSHSWYNADNKDGKYRIAAIPKVEKDFPKDLHPIGILRGRIRLRQRIESRLPPGV